jgi:transposase
MNPDKRTQQETTEYIEKLEKTIVTLQRQVDNLTEALLLLQKQKFGSSSEKTKYADGYEQLCLDVFNEAEKEADEKAAEPAIEEVKAHTRKKWAGNRKEMLKDLPVEKEVVELPEEERLCPVCGEPLTPIGTEKVRSEVEYIPAKLRVREYYRNAYSCHHCLEESDEAVILKSQVPEPVIQNSIASPSTVAQVIYQKYVNAIPLYRQEKEWARIGLTLLRAVMANWVIQCALNWFLPLYLQMQTFLLKEEVLLADETRFQVLKEEGKKATSNSYMWLYRNRKDSETPIILMEYQANRKGEHPKQFLLGFQGYLVTDGYVGYEQVPGITRCMCFAHLRRKFVEALPPGAAGPESKAAVGRDYCNQLFKIERKLAGLEPQERYEKRLVESQPVLEAFFEWASHVNPLPGSKLDKAIHYARNHKEYFQNYLLDGRIPLSNNDSENSIRPFVIIRKNCLFADTPKGARASAVIYSITLTAAANGLKVYEYLTYLLKNLPNINFKEEPSLLNNFLPWSGQIPDECRLNNKEKLSDQ